MKNIIVLGHTGLLGRYVYQYLKKDTSLNTIRLDNFNVIGMGVENVVSKISSYGDIECVVNCIGIIKQRQDTSDENTIKVNAEFPHILFDACTRINAKMIHISTDCVFDSERGNYNELDDTTAYDIYSQSKILGEPSGASVIRASFIGEELNRKLSLLEWVKSQAGKECNGFNNHMWNGITALTLAKIIYNVIVKNMYWVGLRHVFSPNPCSKYELVNLINEIYGLGIIVKEVSAARYVNRVMSTVYPDFITSFDIPTIKEQLVELKNFDINGGV